MKRRRITQRKGGETFDENMSVANTPVYFGHSKIASCDVVGLKPAAYIEGGFIEDTLVPENDGPTFEKNLTSKCLLPNDPAATSSAIIVCKLMTVDEGWHDKTVIKYQTKTEWRHSLPYQCL
jgi:hypothetical protein